MKEPLGIRISKITGSLMFIARELKDTAEKLAEKDDLTASHIRQLAEFVEKDINELEKIANEIMKIRSML